MRERGTIMDYQPLQFEIVPLVAADGVAGVSGRV